MEKQGMDSIHGAILNEGLGYVPFVPQGVKDVAGHYAEREIDKQLEKQTEKHGAGFKKSIARPARKLIKKHVTKKNIKSALQKGKKIGKELGMKDTIESTAVKNITKNKKVQKVLKDEFNTLIGAGVNPYLPTGLITGAGVKGLKVRAPRRTKVYEDQHNVLRPDQSGFKGISVAESELRSVKQAGKSRVQRGSGFRMSGEGFRN